MTDDISSLVIYLVIFALVGIGFIVAIDMTVLIINRVGECIS